MIITWETCVSAGRNNHVLYRVISNVCNKENV